ncbi:MAG TPA: PfkB family carbohydrate kinase, partial [Spirochaetia bacterium]
VELAPVAERLSAWLGPVVPPSRLPRFEISYAGGTTKYLDTFFGSEATLAPESLPTDLSLYDVVHVVPLGDARRQLAFIEACRSRGAGRISAGTYVDSVRANTAAVRKIHAATDVFFLNRDEAVALFGSIEAARTSPGKLLFITLGPEGALVIQGEHVTHVPSVPATQRDPSGAGDTFCGATLAGLIRHQHPVMAARGGTALAAAEIAGVGPSALFSDEPLSDGPDGGVVVDEAQVERVARLLAGLGEVAPFDFTGDGLPPVGDPRALDFFFATTLQQFGFWSETEGRYGAPLVATLGGASLKGAFYLFGAFHRRLEKEGDFCSPARQARLGREELLDVLRADDGGDPMPALDLHLALANAYGRDVEALGLSPASILALARASDQPLQIFLSALDRIAGYKEDPLRKKSGLLALILHQRPEAFLPFGDGEDVEPVIDYHLMRSCLRTGLVEVRDERLRAAIEARRVVDEDAEWAVRHAAWRAIQRVIELSGKSTGAVDWFFFNARRRCPEMTEPECGRCPLDPVCAHRTRMFQPVYRTTFY